METNVIHNVDVLEGFSKLEDGSIDLIITSPPYNVGIEYDSWNDTTPADDYFSWVEKWLTESFRVLKTSGRIAINIPYEVNFKKTGDGRCFIITEYAQILKRVGFKFAGAPDLKEASAQRFKLTAWGSWLSPSAPYVYNPKEAVIIYYKDVWKKVEKGESYFINDQQSKDEFRELVFGEWSYKAETRGLTKANFSLDIPEKALKILSWKEDVVLDPFMGSGTTAVACKKLGRKFIGFEISENYHRIANERIRDFE